MDGQITPYSYAWKAFVMLLLGARRVTAEDFVAYKPSKEENPSFILNMNNDRMNESLMLANRERSISQASCYISWVKKGLSGHCLHCAKMVWKVITLVTVSTLAAAIISRVQ